MTGSGGGATTARYGGGRVSALSVALNYIRQEKDMETGSIPQDLRVAAQNLEESVRLLYEMAGLGSPSMDEKEPKGRAPVMGIGSECMVRDCVYTISSVDIRIRKFISMIETLNSAVGYSIK